MDAGLSLEAGLLPAVMLAVRVGLALLFGISGVGKLRHRARWADMLSAYRLLPGWALAPFALVLPLVELAIAAGLVLGVAGAAVAGAGLMLVFAAAMGINLARGRVALDCGCNPAARPQRISGWLAVRNMAFAGLLLGCALPVVALPVEFAVTAMVAGAIFYLLFHVLAMLRGFAAIAAEPR